MSATECGDDNLSDNTAISLQRAGPKEGEGNVHPVSLVQQIFSDPEAPNLLHTRMVSTKHPRLQPLLQTQTLPECPRLA